MFKNKKFYLDGAMGSEIIKRGFTCASELLNINNPEVVSEIHKSYISSGANIIYTNTFGANPFNYSDEDLKEILNAGINIAKKSCKKYTLVGLDIGSMGKLIGSGGYTFDEVYNAYKKIVTFANDKTDFIVVETINDLVECRTALLAVKENSNLPVVVSMSFEKNGKTIFGNPLSSYAVICESLGADAIGVNCSLCAQDTFEIVKELANYTNLPIFVKPNAGQPIIKNGETTYLETAKNFAENAKNIFSLGVTAVGGCCGTTPEFIKELYDLTYDIPLVKREEAALNYVCSCYQVKSLDNFCVIGERINPTGKKLMQKALLDNDLAYILSLAVSQEEKGADILDVNVGMNGIDEKQSMQKLIDELNSVTNLPLQIDSSDKEVVELALRRYPGRAIVNSVNGKQDVLNEFLPIIKKYGAVVVGLTLDENGIPDDYETRFCIAKKIVEECKKYNVPPKDVIIDTLTMSEANSAGSAISTLNALKEVKKLGVKTILGVSNISFGMPKREIINATFLQMSKDAGLDLAIINPALLAIKQDEVAKEFLLAKEGSVNKYIEYATTVVLEEVKTEEITLDKAIITGQKHLALNVAKNLLEQGKTNIVDEYILPALDFVGGKFEIGEMFLPQLISSAESAKIVMEYLHGSQKIQVKSNGKTFILATVYGDVHDIGKNIVKAVVSNYGFNVIDLGKDVPCEVILQSALQNSGCIVGLSALMTTTVKNMEEVTKKLLNIGVKVICGGAALTKEYCEGFGGIYSRDANETVKLLKKYFQL